MITLGKHEAVEQNSQDVGTKKQKVEGAQGEYYSNNVIQLNVVVSEIKTWT